MHFTNVTQMNSRGEIDVVHIDDSFSTIEAREKWGVACQRSLLWPLSVIKPIQDRLSESTQKQAGCTAGLKFMLPPRHTAKTFPDKRCFKASLCGVLPFAGPRQIPWRVTFAWHYCGGSGILFHREKWPLAALHARRAGFLHRPECSGGAWPLPPQARPSFY